MLNKRREKGHEFYYHAVDAICSKHSDFHGGIPFRVVRSNITLGLRVCSVSFDCGFDNTRLLKKLDSSTVPHLVPWQCMNPVAYSAGRWIVIEAEWPDGYQRDDITLDEITSVRSNHLLTVGVNSFGSNITLPARELEHLLIAGQTGAGKSYTLRSLVYQLGRPDDVNNLLVLLDGKGGEGLGLVSGISPNQVGPLAIDTIDVINALGWCVNEMRQRYAIITDSGGLKLSKDFPHIFVVFDEFQIFTKDGANPTITTLMNTLATQGRAANVHLAACTQKPLVESWGDSTTPDQFSAAIGQRVKTFQASKAIVGGSFPRCDTLLPKGDSYVVATIPDQVVERVQVAYVPEDVLSRAQGCQPMLLDWPSFDTSLSAVGRPTKLPTPKEIAIGIEAVVRGNGRPWYREQFNGDKPGSGRARNLLGMCREVVSVMKERKLDVQTT